jgi:hypothetical protein
MKGPGRRRTGETGSDLGWSALLGGVVGVVLASSVAVVSAARAIDIGPKVGDILVFRPGARMAADWEFAVAKSAGQLGLTCTIQPDVMTSRGGSLVVEQRLAAPRAYRVHWAGARTSNGASDCGSSADLVLSALDLQLLTNAVGGAGVEHRTFPDL